MRYSSAQTHVFHLFSSMEYILSRNMRMKWNYLKRDCIRYKFHVICILFHLITAYNDGREDSAHNH